MSHGRATRSESMPSDSSIEETSSTSEKKDEEPLPAMVPAGRTKSRTGGLFTSTLGKLKAGIHQEELTKLVPNFDIPKKWSASSTNLLGDSKKKKSRRGLRRESEGEGGRSRDIQPDEVSSRDEPLGHERSRSFTGRTGSMEDGPLAHNPYALSSDAAASAKKISISSESARDILSDIKFVENERDDDFLGDNSSPRSRSTSAPSSQPSSRVNSREEVETAANRRAKLLQRFASQAGGITNDSPTMDDSSAVENEEDKKVRVAGSNKKFHKRFDLEEEVVLDDYLCACLLRGTLLAQGSMYITLNYVCFYANIFGKKVRISMPLTEILGIRKCKILKSIPNSIEIHTITKKYFFASFLHRDAAFQLIDKRWRVIRSKMGNPVIDEVRPFDAEDAEIEWGVDDKQDIGLDWQQASGEYVLSAENSPDRGLHELLPPTSPSCSHQQIYDAKKRSSHFEETYPITVEEFYHNFLSNSAEGFWSEFHSRDGYDNFSLTPWVSTLEGCCWQRTAEFKVPLRASPVTKSRTRATQKHHCRSISPDEIMFETVTQVHDVPYANQFVVNARWNVVNVAEGRCKLTIDVTVHFAKKKWLSSVIERNSIDGSRDWFENWIRSSLVVANAVKLNSKIPSVLRRSKQDILRSSIVHLHKDGVGAQNDPTPVWKNKMVWAGLALLFAVFVALLVGLTGSSSVDVEQLTLERNQLEQDYLHLRTATSLAACGLDHTLPSEVERHCHLWRMNDDEKLHGALEEWKAHLKQLESLIHHLASDSKGSAFLTSLGHDPSLYEQIAAMLKRSPSE